VITARRPSLCFTLLATLVSLPAPTSGQDSEAPGRELLLQTKELVRKHLVHPGISEGVWLEHCERYQRALPSLAGDAEIRAHIQALLGELKLSHLALIERRTFDHHIRSELRNSLRPSFGLTILELPEGLFVNQLSDGGPAMRAGVRRGDRLLSINAAAPSDSPVLCAGIAEPGLGGPPSFWLSSQEALELGFERDPDRGPAGRYALRLAPQPWNLCSATRASIRSLALDGRRVGYVHLWHLLNNATVRALRGALLGELKRCAGLVLDLRGPGGAPSEIQEVLRLFESHAADGPRWQRPVVAIIDRGTRSAKELLAFELRERFSIPLVGERTRGAVLGARFFDLKDDSVLMIPTIDMRSLSRGAPLEGRGVKPDVRCNDKLPWSRGRDPLLERALTLLSSRLSQRARAQLR
jgi:carboxyl-terminal processing protease